MITYTVAAPNMSKFVAESEFVADFPEPAPASEGPPQPDAEKKLALYQAYAVEYKARGGAVALSRLAVRMNVPRAWCVILDREVRAAIAAVYTTAEPE